MTGISPEALEKARAVAHMFCLFPPSDKQALEIQIAAALQAERDAAAPKTRVEGLGDAVGRLHDAIEAFEQMCRDTGEYMPAIATILRIHADEMADKYPDDANGGCNGR